MKCLSCESFVPIPLSGPHLESLRMMRQSRDGTADKTRLIPQKVDEDEVAAKRAKIVDDPMVAFVSSTKNDSEIVDGESEKSKPNIPVVTKLKVYGNKGSEPDTLDVSFIFKNITIFV